MNTVTGVELQDLKAISSQHAFTMLSGVVAMLTASYDIMAAIKISVSQEGTRKYHKAENKHELKHEHVNMVVCVST